ncbi:MAG: histidine kinase, partial [Alphaproteobacteria bacterium]|nr:histidine kinase [Alphaproteobacteria bacterium]
LARDQLERLSDREREIFRYVTIGHPNKVIAQILGISPRTVEAHRARIQQKLQITGFAELLQLAQDAEFHGTGRK